MWGLRMGFTDPPFFFFFSSPLTFPIHPRSFILRQMSLQSGTLSLAVFFLSFFFFWSPTCAFLCFCSYLSTHVRCLTHTHTHISVALNQRFVKVTSHTQQDRLQHQRRGWGGSGQYWWYILYTYTQRSRGRCFILCVETKPHTWRQLWTF